MTGYDVTNIGEIEIAAWELASGGFGNNLFFWLVQIVVVLLGAPLCPLLMLAALRLGHAHAYGLACD